MQTKTPLLETVAAYEKKLKRPALKWLEEDRYPPLYWKDGTALDLNTIRFLFHLQKKENRIEPTAETLPFYEQIDLERSADFALFLLAEIQKNGSFYAKNRPVFVPLALLGDDRIIPPIKKFILDKNNPTAPAILGLLGSMGAARALSQIIHSLKTKYPNVRTACQVAFDKIAAKKGVSSLDLLDDMVPDFGFVGLFYEFSVQHVPFQAFVTAKGSLNFVDKIVGTIRKTVPAKTNPTIKQHFKEITKEIKALLKQQKSSLEQFMLENRRWKADRWKAHFLAKPVPFALSQGLVWGIYDANNELTNTFTITEDQTLENVAFEEVTLDEKDQLGVIHPLELTEAARKKWQAYLVEAEALPPFPQIMRPIFSPNERQREEPYLAKYHQRLTNGLSNKAIRRGWRRGTVVDNGMISGFYKEFPTAKVDVFVIVSGLFVGQYGEPVTIEKAFFIRHGASFTGKFYYNSYSSKQAGANFIAAADVPPIVYSEVIADMELFVS